MPAVTDAQRKSWRQMMRMAFQLSGELGRQISASTGLSYQDYLVLAVLEDQDDGRLRAFELGSELGWEKSRVSHHVARMTDRTFVRRDTVPTDRRGSFVAITKQGRAALEKARPVHDAVVRSAFLQHVSPDELRAIEQIAARVISALASDR